MSGEDDAPRNVLGHRQYYAFGRRLRHDPRPQKLVEVVNEKNRLRRALTYLTQGLERLEYAAEVCSQMNMRLPQDAIRHCRRKELGEQFDGFPLCELEQLMAKRAPPFVVLLCYGMVKPAVKVQLDVIRAGVGAGRSPPLG